MTDLVAVLLWVVVYVAKGVPLLVAYYLGKRAGRRRHLPSRRVRRPRIVGILDPLAPPRDDA